jgi:cytochrome c oxidase subunit 4
MSSESHSADDAHHAAEFRAYMVVFAALSVFTVVSFVVNAWVQGDREGRALIGFVIILSVAVVKTCLVGLYFMHLKYDWGKVFFMIVPCFILAMMLVVVLLPDQVLWWKHDDPWDMHPVATPVAPEHGHK